MDFTLSYILFSLSLLLLTKVLLNLYNNNKKLPPSPLAVPILGHLHLLKKPRHRSLALISSRHGPIVFLRFGLRKVLLVSSPSLAEECFTKNDIIFASRPRLPSARHLSYNYTSLSSAPYGPHWRNLRRLATLEIFSHARIHSFSASRASEVKILVKQLFHDSNTSPKVEMKARLFGLLLNVMMGMIAGKRYYGEKEDDAEEARKFKEIIEEGFVLAGSSTLGDFIPGLWWADFQGLEKKMSSLKKRMDSFLQALIDEERNKVDDKNQKKSLLTVMLSLQKSDEVIKSIMSVSKTSSYLQIQITAVQNLPMFGGKDPPVCRNRHFREHNRMGDVSSPQQPSNAEESAR